LHISFRGGDPFFTRNLRVFAINQLLRHGWPILNTVCGARSYPRVLSSRSRHLTLPSDVHNKSYKGQHLRYNHSQLASETLCFGRDGTKASTPRCRTRCRCDGRHCRRRHPRRGRRCCSGQCVFKYHEGRERRERRLKTKETLTLTMMRTREVLSTMYWPIRTATPLVVADRHENLTTASELEGPGAQDILQASPQLLLVRTL
jgi:hypothetical protein